jgi:outer membrane protein assembly factor BamB
MALCLGSLVTASCSAQSGTDRQARNSDSRNRSSSEFKLASNNRDDWPRFRGPTGMGNSDARDLPVAWSSDEHLGWKTPLPGAGASSPIVIGDRIYLTCYTGYHVPGETGGSLNDLQRHLVCLQRENGQIVWDQAVTATLPEEERIRDHGFAANSPVADDERVFVFFGKTGVLAFDHSGNQLWKADVGSNTHGWGTGASPILYRDFVIVNASVESESLVALDQATGKERWRAEGIRESWNTPLVVQTESGEDELVVAIHGQVLGFDPASGKQLWSCATDITWYMVPSAVAADGVVYFLGGRSGTAGLAVRAGGRGDVTGTHRLWTSSKGSNVTSPVLHEDHLYWAHEKRGIAYCAAAATGEIVYEERLNRAGQVYASALLADDRVYYLTRDGRMFVVAARPEFELLATNDLRDGGQFNASPVVMGDRLLLRSDKFLYCIQP